MNNNILRDIVYILHLYRYGETAMQSGKTLSVYDGVKEAKEIVRVLLDELERMGPKDVKVEASGSTPPQDPLVAADQAYNHANKCWRAVLKEIRGRMDV